MTEQEWLQATDPQPMLEFLRGKVSDRKLRHWGCSCCEQIADLFPDETYSLAVQAAVRFADGSADADELQHYHQRVADGWPFRPSPLPDAVYAIQFRVMEAVCAVSSHERIQLEYTVWFNAALALEGRRLEEVHADAADSVLVQWLEATSEYNHDTEGFLRWADVDPRLAFVTMLHDIIGNPFRPISINSTWLTWHNGLLMSMAQRMCDSRDFSDMPVLADALEEAGCNNADILQHCRQPGEHVRGCWLVDLILGKE
jgi:hypothetical protein